MRFERATNYDKFALAQDRAADELCGELAKISREWGAAYEIGCGSGLLTRRLARDFKFESLTLNDLYESAAMRGFARQIGDVARLDLPAPLDLVASASAFQWIEDLPALSAKLAAALVGGGTLAFSAFCEGTLARLSAFTGQGLAYKSAEEFEAIFARDFCVKTRKTGRFVQSFASLRELLTSLKETGVNNVRGDFRLTKGSLNAMAAHFAGRYELEYNYVIMICKKEKK